VIKECIKLVKIYGMDIWTNEQNFIIFHQIIRNMKKRKTYDQTTICPPKEKLKKTPNFSIMHLP